MNPILLIPGIGNPGPGHWQSLWENNLPKAYRVEMPNWEAPRRAEWIEALDSAIRRVQKEESTAPLLVAHSLGCLAVVHWSEAYRRPIQGALLVAPPDVEHPDTLERIRHWAPIPRHSLPFQTHVVASSDDPYCSLERAKAFAEAWEARFTSLGSCGHLNAAAGFGEWPRGEALLQELR